MFRDYKNYDVQPDGRIWSKVSKKWLKPSKGRDGYLQVWFYDNDGKRHTIRHHKVIYCAVNGLWNLPSNYELHHLDEVKTNNQIGNLLLCSHKQNCNFGTHNARVAAAQSKRVGAYKDGELQIVFASTREAGRQGYNQGAVSDCCNGKRKTHKGYEWRYLDDEQ